MPDLTNSDLAAVNEQAEPATTAPTPFEDLTTTLQELQQRQPDGEIPTSFGYALITSNGQQVEPDEFWAIRGQ